MSEPIPPEVIVAAQLSHKNWGIPASVTIAQWALESARGTRMPAGSNNPFGMKAKPGQPSVITTTHEVYRGHRVLVQASFRKFSNLNEAFDAHGKLLATAGVYSHAREALPDPYRFATALTGVYATDPNYGASLGNIMRSGMLTQYD